MTLDELHTRWMISPCKIDIIVVNHPNLPRYQRDGFQHSAPMGDFLQAYMDHVSIPWYRKQWDWSLVKSEMIRHFNQVGLRFHSLK